MGQAKLLQHKMSKRIRLLMRREKTLKICANHLVLPSLALKEHAGSDKAWVWSAYDNAEGEAKTETFCIKFGSVESAGPALLARDPAPGPLPASACGPLTRHSSLPFPPRRGRAVQGRLPGRAVNHGQAHGREGGAAGEGRGGGRGR